MIKVEQREPKSMYLVSFVSFGEFPHFQSFRCNEIILLPAVAVNGRQAFLTIFSGPRSDNKRPQLLVSNSVERRTVTVRRQYRSNFDEC